MNQQGNSKKSRAPKLKGLLHRASQQEQDKAVAAPERKLRVLPEPRPIKLYEFPYKVSRSLVKIKAMSSHNVNVELLLRENRRLQVQLEESLTQNRRLMQALKRERQRASSMNRTLTVTTASQSHHYDRNTLTTPNSLLPNLARLAHTAEANISYLQKSNLALFPLENDRNMIMRSQRNQESIQPAYSDETCLAVELQQIQKELHEVKKKLRLPDRFFK